MAWLIFWCCRNINIYMPSSYINVYMQSSKYWYFWYMMWSSNYRPVSKFYNDQTCYCYLGYHLSFFFLVLVAFILCWWDVGEGIWNPIHLVVFNFCPERLHHVDVTISHDKARSNRWCQWPVLFVTTYRTVSFCNWDFIVFSSSPIKKNPRQVYTR